MIFALGKLLFESPVSALLAPLLEQSCVLTADCVVVSRDDVKRINEKAEVRDLASFSYLGRR